MKPTKREIILDLFIINSKDEIAATLRDETDVYEKGVVSALILTLPLGNHPIEYIKNYLKRKEIEKSEITMLPALYLNKFDTEAEIDYLVLSFTAKVETDNNLHGDRENPMIAWMAKSDFFNHPKLMPEYKRNGISKLFEGKSLFYKGFYKESDASYEVLEFEELK